MQQPASFYGDRLLSVQASPFPVRWPVPFCLLWHQDGINDMNDPIALVYVLYGYPGN